jgi:molybdate transport system substrate-binding protein
MNGEQLVRRAPRFWSVALVVAALGLVGGTGVAQAAKAKKVSGTITVSAAASLTEAFTKMGADFQKANPGTSVTFNFAASSALVQQIQGGAPADVFASADGTNMQKLVAGGQVTAEPTVFAANELTIVVKKGNPTKVKSLADLADLDVVSLCADAVPCGKYAQQALVGAGATIAPEKITKGADVKTTLAAVSTGDAEAAIVYTTDAKAAGTSVQSVKIPAWLNVYAIYPIAPVAASTNQDLAEAWVEYTVSPAGQKALESFGFLPPPLQ